MGTFRLYKVEDWDDAELERLRVARASYLGPRMGGKSTFHLHLARELPHRTSQGIQYGVQLLRSTNKKALVRKHITRARRLNRYEPLILTDVESAYLAAMLEAEGYISEPRGRKGFVLGLITNTDLVLVNYVMEKVPFARLKQLGRESSLGKKYCYQVTVNVQGGIHEVLRFLLPYIRGEKRIKAQKAFDGTGIL